MSARLTQFVSRVVSPPRRRLAALGLAALAAGCVADYERTDIGGIVESPLGGTVTYGAVAVPEGMVVKAHIAPFNDDGNPLTCELASEDPSVVGVSQTIGDKDYAFYGLKEGRTRVNVRAGDRVVLVLEAIVTPQPPGPL